MTEISIRELRNHGGDVVERASRGEHLTITKAGKPVAELRGLRRTPVPLSSIIDRWKRLPKVDPERFRRDVDAVVDPAL